MKSKLKLIDGILALLIIALAFVLVVQCSEKERNSNIAFGVLEARDAQGHKPPEGEYQKVNSTTWINLATNELYYEPK